VRVWGGGIKIKTSGTNFQQTKHEELFPQLMGTASATVSSLTSQMYLTQ